MLIKLELLLLKRMFRWGCGVDLPKVGGGGVQSPNQKEEIKLLLRRIGGKMVIGLSLGGQNHTRKVRAFLHRGSSVAVKRTQLLRLKIGS